MSRRNVPRPIQGQLHLSQIPLLDMPATFSSPSSCGWANLPSPWGEPSRWRVRGSGCKVYLTRGNVGSQYTLHNLPKFVAFGSLWPNRIVTNGITQRRFDRLDSVHGELCGLFVAMSVPETGLQTTRTCSCRVRKVRVDPSTPVKLTLTSPPD